MTGSNSSKVIGSGMRVAIALMSSISLFAVMVPQAHADDGQFIFRYEIPLGHSLVAPADPNYVDDEETTGDEETTEGDPGTTNFDLAYNIPKAIFYLDEDTLAPVDQGQDTATPIITGTVVQPSLCEIDLPPAQIPAGFSINSTTCELTGTPTEFGEWDLPIILTDDTGETSGPTTLTVFSTKSGNVEYTDGGDSRTLRVNQPFSTSPIVVENAVGNVTFSPNRTVVGDGLNISATDGSISPSSYISVVDSDYNFKINATDEDGRGFASSPTYNYNVIAPLTLDLPSGQTNITKEIQWNAPFAFLFAEFSSPTIENQIGDIEWEIRGGYPGTLVTLYEDEEEEEVYEYIDGGTTVTTDDEDDLPDDAFIFDRDYQTIDWVPTDDDVGTYTFELVAKDTHITNYTNPTSPQISDNEASKQITLEITKEVAPLKHLYWRVTGHNGYGSTSLAELDFKGIWDAKLLHPCCGGVAHTFAYHNAGGEKNLGDTTALFDFDEGTQVSVPAALTNRFVIGFTTPQIVTGIEITGHGPSAPSNTVFNNSTSNVTVEYSDTGLSGPWIEVPSSVSTDFLPEYNTYYYRIDL